MQNFKNSLKSSLEYKNNIQKLRFFIASFLFFNLLSLSASLSGYSSIIPAKKHTDILRIATYNTRGDQSENFKKEAIEAIKHIDADVIVLQEIMLTQREIRAFLSLLGYNYFVFDSHAKNYSICSKIPVIETILSKKQIQEYKHLPALAKIEVDFSCFGKKYDKKNLIMYSALFDKLNQKKRLLEAQSLVKLLQKNGNSSYKDQGKNILLTAGFNQERGSVINYLGAHGFINNFDMAGTTALRPLLSGTQKVGDGMYASRENWNLFCEGSYLYSSQQNNHLSVIIDFDLAK